MFVGNDFLNGWSWYLLRQLLNLLVFMGLRDIDEELKQFVCLEIDTWSWCL